MDFAGLKLAAFDMDGTLLNGDSQMSPLAKEACLRLRERGYKLLITSGRTYISAILPTDGFPFDGYVCSNGAAVYESDGRLVKSSPLDSQMVISAVELFRRRAIYYELHDTDGNRWMVDEDRQQIEQMLDQEPELPERSLRRFGFYRMSRMMPREELYQTISQGTCKVVKLFIWHQKKEELKWVREQLAAWQTKVDVTSSGTSNVEVVVKGVNKWEGVRFFLDKWGILPEQVVAFGDADNDREILSRAGVSVAMGNANEDIKNVAHFVAGDHAEEGVARFIRDHLLKHP